MSVPWSSKRPALGDSMPHRMRSKVVLPQPDGPSKATNSPSPMSRSMPSSTVVLPKRLCTRWICRNCGLRAAAAGRWACAAAATAAASTIGGISMEASRVARLGPASGRRALLGLALVAFGPLGEDAVAVVGHEVEVVLDEPRFEVFGDVLGPGSRRRAGRRWRSSSHTARWPAAWRPSRAAPWRLRASWWPSKCPRPPCPSPGLRAGRRCRSARRRHASCWRGSRSSARSRIHPRRLGGRAWNRCACSCRCSGAAHPCRPRPFARPSSGSTRRPSGSPCPTKPGAASWSAPWRPGSWGRPSARAWAGRAWSIRAGSCRSPTTRCPCRPRSAPGACRASSAWARPGPWARRAAASAPCRAAWARWRRGPTPRRPGGLAFSASSLAVTMPVLSRTNFNSIVGLSRSKPSL